MNLQLANTKSINWLCDILSCIMKFLHKSSALCLFIVRLISAKPPTIVSERYILMLMQGNT